MAMKQFIFKIAWAGHGWYSGRFVSDTTIIVEKSPNGDPDAKAIDAGQGAVWYAEPPEYMIIETEENRCLAKL